METAMRLILTKYSTPLRNISGVSVSKYLDTDSIRMYLYHYGEERENFTLWLVK